jgi:hypothetical protein
MANFVPQWVGVDTNMSAQPLMSAYTEGSNPYVPKGNEPTLMQIKGFDPSLGTGYFIYAQCSNAAGIVAGNVCEITQTLFSSGASVSLISSVQQWAGTANSAKALCVALVTLAQNQYGWFQIYGNAFVTTSGAIAVGNGASWQALGVVQAAVVASKQASSFQAMVAPAANFGQAVGGVVPVMAANTSIYFINGPEVQGAIT